MSQFKNLSSHILQTSASMVGVCMMIISIVKLIHMGGTMSRMVDKILAFDNVVFLLSAILSYASMRYERWAVHLENMADTMFIVGLICMTVASLVLSLEIF